MIHLTRRVVRRWLDTLLHIEDTPERTAAAFALGVFFGFSPFLGLHTLLGIAFACGMASTFKYIGDDFPENMGAISGIVGMAGGLGGFLLPIMFGAILDWLGVNSSCFMLLYGIVWVSLILNYLTEVRRAPVMGETIEQTTATGLRSAGKGAAI